MTEKKKSTYRGFTEAQARASKKYAAQFVTLKTRMTSDRRDEIKAHAAEMGESANTFVLRAIDETMERDKDGSQE